MNAPQIGRITHGFFIPRKRKPCPYCGTRFTCRVCAHYFDGERPQEPAPKERRKRG